MPDPAAAMPALSERKETICGPLSSPAFVGERSFQSCGDRKLRNAKEKKNATQNEKRPKVGMENERGHRREVAGTLIRLAPLEKDVPKSIIRVFFIKSMSNAIEMSLAKC